MLHFDGDRDFPLSPVDLWSKLRDAGFLITCIPDATIKGQPQRDQAACSVRPQLAFIGGTLDTTIEILSGNEPTELEYRITSKGIGSSTEVETRLTIAATAAGSRVHWVADVKRLGGLLKAIPSGLIRGAAQKTIADVWERIGQTVAGG